MFASSLYTLHQANYHFTTYTQKDGLPSGTIRDIGKDSTGFLWLLSENGLCRFDGYTFKTFRHDPAVESSISSNQVNKMAVHKGGKILFATSNSICSYNPLTETFKVLIPLQTDKSIEDFFCNESGFWVLKTSLLIHIDPQDETVTSYPIQRFSS